MGELCQGSVGLNRWASHSLPPPFACTLTHTTIQRTACWMALCQMPRSTSTKIGWKTTAVQVSYVWTHGCQPATQCAALETLSTPGSPSNHSIKRKRSFTESAQDRKLQKLSSSLANDIARSLSVSMDDVDMTTPHQPFVAYNKPLNEENPMPALRRISLSGTLSPPSASSMEQWLKLQAQNHNIPFSEYNALFHDKQKLLRNQLELLQRPDQSFDSLRDHLSKVLRLADELSGDHTKPFIVRCDQDAVCQLQCVYSNMLTT